MSKREEKGLLFWMTITGMLQKMAGLDIDQCGCSSQGWEECGGYGG